MCEILDIDVPAVLVLPHSTHNFFWGSVPIFPCIDSLRVELADTLVEMVLVIAIKHDGMKDTPSNLDVLNSTPTVGNSHILSS